MPTQDDVTVTTEDGAPSIRLNISGRTVYAALKNLLVQHYGITRENIFERITEAVNLRARLNEWFNGEHFRKFVSDVARGVVKEMAAQVIRDEGSRNHQRSAQDHRGLNLRSL